LTLEVNLRSDLSRFIGSKVGAGLELMAGNRIHYLATDMAQFSIECHDSLVVLSAGSEKTILRSFNLNLKVMEGRISLESRILFLQLLERSMNPLLFGLVLGELLSILKVTSGRIEVNGACLCTGL